MAANGDKLFVTLTGSGTFTGAGFGSTSLGTITGGTGRFAGASGTYTVTISSVITSVTGSSITTSDTSTFEGHISY